MWKRVVGVGQSLASNSWIHMKEGGGLCWQLGGVSDKARDKNETKGFR